MEEIGEEQKFLEKVTVFSVTATSSGFQIRVHRAERVESDARIRPNYPLCFEFDELFHTTKIFSRAEISGIIRNILVDYGVKTLLPILKDAVKTFLAKKFKEEQLQSVTKKRPAEDRLDSFRYPGLKFNSLRCVGLLNPDLSETSWDKEV